VGAVQAAGSHGLWIEFATPNGTDSLLVSADGHSPRISLGANRPAGPGPLSPLVQVARRVLPGSILESVDHRGLDRLVALEFAYPLPVSGAGCRLIAELFERRPNLILADRLTGCILEAARRVHGDGGRAIGPDHEYSPPPPPARPDPRVLGTVEAISARLAPQLMAGLPPAVALRQALAGLTTLWAQEVVSRAEDGTAAALSRALLALLREVEGGPWDPRLVLDGAGRPVAVSPIGLLHPSQERQQPCSSLGEAQERLAVHRGRQEGLAAGQAALRRLLRRLEVRLRSRRAKLAAESLEFSRADELRRMGEILVAHQQQARKGLSQVTLPDHASGPGETITIPLDPALSAAENGERLFKAARRGRRGAVRVTARLAETEAELGRVHGWSHRVATASSPEELEAIRQEIEGIPRLLTPQDRAMLGEGSGGGVSVGGEERRAGPKRGRGTGPEPRRFISSDGLPILVGRDTEGNDHLTQHIARSHDLWLHVQGHSGSHVVVQLPSRSADIPRRTLLQAAQLAAYYSQARKHGKVAVDYTLRKHVRKPRKAKPGLVTITQEKTIIVAPDKALVQKLAASRDD
jgi:predicted ribosome quality control (RQC) complex YloA/Tae2 family protein